MRSGSALREVPPCSNIPTAVPFDPVEEDGFVDPNLFHVDLQRLFEALVAIIILSFFVERTLSLIFEHRLWVKHLHRWGLKAPIAFVLAFLICRSWDFDAISTIIVAEQTRSLGHVITAGVVAGGSKASIKLFHDLMNAMSDAEKERKRIGDVPKAVEQR